MAKPYLFSFQPHSADSVPSKHPTTLTHTHWQHTWIFERLSCKYWTHNNIHWQTDVHKHTHSHRASTHIYCLSCVSMKKPEPWAVTDLNWDSCFNHLLANSSLCRLQVESGSIASLSHRVQLYHHSVHEDGPHESSPKTEAWKDSGSKWHRQRLYPGYVDPNSWGISPTHALITDRWLFVNC